MIGETYHQRVLDLLNRIAATQAEALSAAAHLIKEAMDAGGVVHAFSTGHSHMMVEEMFYRTGGLVPVNPILDPGTMLHEGAAKSTRIERLPGYAGAVLDNVETRPGEPILIISNSGVNAVPVEMATCAKERGMPVIAITAVALSRTLKPKLPSGLRLQDVADVVLDNCIEGSDAAVQIPHSEQQAGAVSSLAGVYLVERLMLRVIELYVENGETPPIFASANIPGGDEWNAVLIQKYRSRIKAL